MFDKINQNLSTIIYRYEWQHKILQVHKELFTEFVYIEGDYIRTLHRYNYGISLGNNEFRPYENFMTLNDRDFTFVRCIFHLNLQNHTYYKPNISMDKYENRQYTSTKYLREIKERGVVCLVDN